MYAYSAHVCNMQPVQSRVMLLSRHTRRRAGWAGHDARPLSPWTWRAGARRQRNKVWHGAPRMKTRIPCNLPRNVSLFFFFFFLSFGECVCAEHFIRRGSTLRYRWLNTLRHEVGVEVPCRGNPAAADRYVHGIYLHITMQRMTQIRINLPVESLLWRCVYAGERRRDPWCSRRMEVFGWLPGHPVFFLFHPTFFFILHRVPHTSYSSWLLCRCQYGELAGFLAWATVGWRLKVK